MATEEELEGYYQKIQSIRKLVAEDQGPRCTCPRTNCIWHGNCNFCVQQHRLIGDHLPHCLQPILENKIVEIARVVEMSVSKKPIRSSEYMDYVRKKEGEHKE